MEQEQDRSEAPTAYKLMRARQKGQVARGIDLSFLVMLIFVLGYIWIAGLALVTTLTQAMREAFITGPGLAGDQDAMFALISIVSERVERPVLSLSVGLLAIVLLTELLQTGFVFSTDPIRFDFSRLNPAQGLKRIFSLRLLAESSKNLIKFVLYPLATWLILRSLLHAEVASIRDADSLSAVIQHLAIRLIAVFAGLAFIFAVLDQLMVRRNFFKRMRMSRRELKREVRDREGEPRLKQKRKQMHAEFVRNSRSMKGVRNADMLIVNPLHIAVALRYDPKTMTAPIVVANGINRLALRLKSVAFLYNIPVIEDKALARSLIRAAAIDQPIPSTAFRSVASLYNRLRRQRVQDGK